MRQRQQTVGRLGLWMLIYVVFMGIGRPSVQAQTKASRTPPWGQKVVALSIVAPPLEDVDALLRWVNITVGQPLQAESCRRAIERLYALGRFNQIEVHQAPKGDGILLSFVVSPRVTVEDIKVIGADKVDLDGLFAAIRLAPGDTIESLTPLHVQNRAQTFLHRKGFALADATLGCRPSAQGLKQRCTLKVVLGPPVKVIAINLLGFDAAPTTVLRRHLKTRLDAPLDRERLVHDRNTLEKLLWSHGFLRARVQTPVITHTEAGVRVQFIGTLHNRVALHVVGNTSVTDAHILAQLMALDLPLDDARVARLARNVEDLYKNKSFAHAKVVARLVAAPEDDGPFRVMTPGVERLIVSVDEGVPSFVTRIVVKGASELSPTLLQSQIAALLAQHESPTGPPIISALQPMSQTNQQARHVWVPMRYNEEVLQKAGEDFVAGLHDAGHLDAELSRTQDSVRTASNSNDVEVVYHIDQGPVYRINSIKFLGVDAHEVATLRGIVDMTSMSTPLTPKQVEGALFSPSGIEEARVGLLRHLRAQGLLYAVVHSRWRVDGPDPLLSNDQAALGERSVDVTFDIEKGAPVHVGDLVLRGNVHTRSAIIKSRMQMKKNHLFTQAMASDDQGRVLALGTFKTVNLRLIDPERQETYKDIVVEMEERKRQPIEVAPGLSTAAGPRLRLSYSHINVLGTATTFFGALRVNRQIFFDLFGPYADTLRERYAAWRGLLQLTKAIEREIRLGLKFPPIARLPLDPQFRVDVVDQRINAVRYGLETTTATVAADVGIGKRIKLTLETQVGLQSLECPLGDNCDQSMDVRHLQGGRPIQQGIRRGVKVGPRLVIEGRDNIISPKKGYVISFRATQALGVARPTTVFVPFSFTKYESSVTGYVPLGPSVLALALRLGTLQMQEALVPVDERFFMGGRDSLRGFVEGTLIAEDACVVARTDLPLPPHCAEAIAQNPAPPLSLGGNSQALVKVEWRLPLAQALSFDLFCDLGNLWVVLSRTMRLVPRIGTGVGLRYATPVGAMALDLAFNPMPRAVNLEPFWQVHFSIGSF